MNNQEERRIQITGQSNRYQIKKLITTINPEEKTPRLLIQKLNIDDSFFSMDKQKGLDL